MAMDFGGLLSKAKAPALAPMPDTPEPEDEDEGDSLTARVQPIAQDLVDAIRGGDIGAVADALIAANKAIAAGPSDSSLAGEE